MKIKFDLIGIFVKYLNTMVSFYKDIIGLSTDWRGNGPYAEFNHDRIRFAMFERKELPALLGVTPDYPKKLNGTFELALNVGDPKNVDLKFNELV